MKGVRRGVAYCSVELGRCGAVGRAAGDCVDFLRCVATAFRRGGSRHVLRVANFARAMASRRFALTASSTTLRFASLRFASLIGSC